MVYCVQIRAAFSTAARRDTVLSDIQSRIAGKSRWSVDVLEARPLQIAGVTQPNGLFVVLRFTSSADADDLRARVEAFAVNARAPLAGSVLVLHNCPHDEGTDDCAVVATRTW